MKYKLSVFQKLVSDLPTYVAFVTTRQEYDNAKRWLEFGVNNDPEYFFVSEEKIRGEWVRFVE